MTIASELSNIFEVVVVKGSKGMVDQVDIHKLHSLWVICNVRAKCKDIKKHLLGLRSFFIFHEAVFEVGGTPIS